MDDDLASDWLEYESFRLFSGDYQARRRIGLKHPS